MLHRVIVIGAFVNTPARRIAGGEHDAARPTGFHRPERPPMTPRIRTWRTIPRRGPGCKPARNRCGGG